LNFGAYSLLQASKPEFSNRMHHEFCKVYRPASEARSSFRSFSSRWKFEFWSLQLTAGGQQAWVFQQSASPVLQGLQACVSSQKFVQKFFRLLGFWTLELTAYCGGSASLSFPTECITNSARFTDLRLKPEVFSEVLQVAGNLNFGAHFRPSKPEFSDWMHHKFYKVYRCVSSQNFFGSLGIWILELTAYCGGPASPSFLTPSWGTMRIGPKTRNSK
jgi:hypothetical protein